MPSLVALLSALLCDVAGAAEPSAPPPGVTIRLWDGPAPGVIENVGPEQFDTEGRVKNVSVPALTAYLPEKKLATGTAIIVCSGGAYNQLAAKRVGDEAATLFLPRGIAVFSLKYRLRSASKNIRLDAMADGERAMRLVRSRAKEWNLDPQRIGIIGYSAGANLILNLLSNFDDGTPDSPDAIERQSSRPDFAGLFAAWPDSQKITSFRFSKATPPVFLAHAADDTTAPVSFARQIEAELKKAEVPVHAEFFDDGGHGAFSPSGGRHRDWPERLLAWLKELGLLREASGG